MSMTPQLAHCPRCNARREVTRARPDATRFLLASIFSGGLASLLYLLLTATGLRPRPWKCTRCGAQIPRSQVTREPEWTWQR